MHGSILGNETHAWFSVFGNKTHAWFSRQSKNGHFRGFATVTSLNLEDCSRISSFSWNFD